MLVNSGTGAEDANRGIVDRGNDEDFLIRYQHKLSLKANIRNIPKLWIREGSLV